MKKKSICNLTSKKEVIKIRRKIKTKKIKYKTKPEITKFIEDLSNEKMDKPKIIPQLITQVWHDKSNIPKSVKESIKKLKHDNPEFKHTLFDEKECREFIKNNYSKTILNTYDNIIPHAIKADLFRYCYLYKHGGIYLDCKYYCINNFKFIYLLDREYFCKDIDTSFGGIYNALIICKPKNKILLKTISKLVENVKNKYYGSFTL